jgi:CRP-like cAMP-binding protein
MLAALESELLSTLQPHEAEAVLALATPVRLPAGTTLFELGGAASALFVIERGRVSLTLPMRLDGREADLLVEEKVAGQVVGWSAIIPPHRFTLKAAAAVDSELVAIPSDALLALFERQPSVAYRVTCNVAAVVGQRLQVFQAMWLRQMQRLVEGGPSWTGAAR